MRKLRTVGRILVIAAGCLAVVAVLFHFVYRPWQLNWGATDEEIKRAMAGDEIVPDPTFNATRAVTVNAPAERIWPWIVQMGYRRAGFYSWDILDNDGIPSAERILPEYQNPKVGDLVPLTAKVKILVAVAEPNRRLLLVTQSPTPWTWSWGLYPIDAHRTRLVSRLRVRLRRLPSRLWIDAFEIVMMRKCLLGIKRRAERRDDGARKTPPEGEPPPIGGSSRRDEGAGHPLRGGEMRGLHPVKEVSMFDLLLRRSTLVAALAACPALAQTSDFGLLVGAHAPASTSVRPLRVATTLRASVTLAYGHRLAGFRAGDLLLEVPLAVSARASETVSREVSAGVGATVFLTPGVRLLLAPASPVRPYAVLGAGVGSFDGSEVSVMRDVEVRLHRSTSPAVGLGGGLDIRLARLLSLRGEIRDFVSRAGLGGAPGRHHVVFGVGAGVHFR